MLLPSLPWLPLSSPTWPLFKLNESHPTLYTHTMWSTNQLQCRWLLTNAIFNTATTSLSSLPPTWSTSTPTNASYQAVQLQHLGLITQVSMSTLKAYVNSTNNTTLCFITPFQTWHPQWPWPTNSRNSSTPNINNNTLTSLLSFNLFT